MSDQGGEAEHMLASAMREETQAIAGTIFGVADADVIEVGQAETMDRKAAAADVTGNLFEHIIMGAAILGDAQHADAEAVRPAQQADEARSTFGGCCHVR